VAHQQSLVQAMSEDILKRARRALEASGGGSLRAPSVQSLSRPDALLERARAAAGADRTKEQPPRIEHVRLPVTCSATGRPFVGIAERSGGSLLLVGHEAPQPGGGHAGTPAKLSGNYSIRHAPSYACPHCRSSDTGWSCTGCPQAPDAFHCGGTRGRLRYCACGRLEERELVIVEKLEVRGTATGSAMGSRLSTPAGRRNAPALPRR
jgi:hypothetical protein